MISITVFLLSTFLYFIYKYFTSTFNYFKKQGIRGPNPVPLFGNYYGIWKKQYHEVLMEERKKYGKVYGVFEGRTPNLIVSDPKLIRDIFIKEFDAFTNRRDFGMNHPYLINSVGVLRDQKWKDVRSAMSVSFSSGKLKNVYEQIDECAIGMINHLNSVLKLGEKEINAKHFTTGYSLDVISYTAMGMKVTTIWEPNDPFVEKGMNVLKGLGESTPAQVFALMLLHYPSIGRIIPATVFGELDFFIAVTKEIMAQKKKAVNSNNNVEVDKLKTTMLDMLIAQSKEEKDSPLKDEKVLFAQVLVFLLAGFETVAATLSSVLHCFAAHPEIQERVREEIKEKEKEHGGLTYDCIQCLSYLEQCILESMRLHPPLVKLERECGKDLDIDGIRIEKGSIVSIPTYVIHHDPEVYPEPHRYDPERFSPEQKMGRDPVLYQPFGHGPRGCLGQRMAMLELLIGTAHLLKNFEFRVPKKPKDTINFLDGIHPLFSMVASEVQISIKKIRNV